MKEKVEIVKISRSKLIKALEKSKLTMDEKQDIYQAACSFANCVHLEMDFRLEVANTEFNDYMSELFNQDIEIKKA